MGDAADSVVQRALVLAGRTDRAGNSAASTPTISVGIVGDTRLRCASVLKPLLFWAATRCEPFRSDQTGWAELAEPAVTVSANEPTVRLWQACGSGPLLAALRSLTGLSWPLEPGGVRPFGRVLIRADHVALGYGRLAAAAGHPDADAARLLQWMRLVPQEQTFGARSAAAQVAAVDPKSIAVKAGWFCDTDETALRTHTVTVVPGDPPAVAVVLTAVVASPTDLALYAQTYARPADILDLHNRYAGRLLLAGNREMLSRAGELRRAAE